MVDDDAPKQELSGASELVDKIEKLTLANFAKPKSFVHGQDFRQFCVKFKRYVEISNIKRENLNLIFLSMLDNRTDKLLSRIELTDEQKASAEQFCKIYVN